MGKKRVSKRAAAAAAAEHDEEPDYDSDDAMSLASVETGMSIGASSSEFYDSYTRSEKQMVVIDQAIEDLEEKRTTTRVAALKTLSDQILQYLPEESISESFVSNVLNCLRKPSEAEAVSASRIVGTMALVFGEDNESFYQRVKTVLEPLAKTSRNEKAKVAAIQALSVACFVCSTEQENVDDMLAILENLFRLKIVGSIVAMALKSWGLLSCSLQTAQLTSDEYMGRFLPKFVELLDHSDVEVRSAAGENIALLFETSQQASMPWPYDDELLARLNEMSKESSKRNSKKDRKIQRSVFRDIYATLAEGETLHVNMSLTHETLQLHSWRNVKQFEALKDLLQSGLQPHLKYNNTLRMIVKLPPTTAHVREDLAVDRRDVFDKKSSSRKQRANQMKDDRKRKQNMQEAFLEDY